MNTTDTENLEGRKLLLIVKDVDRLQSDGFKVISVFPNTKIPNTYYVTVILPKINKNRISKDSNIISADFLEI